MLALVVDIPALPS